MRALWLLAIACACACAHGRATRAPAAGVRAEVAAAETAEQARRHDAARVHYERALALARDPASVAFARHEYAETLVTWGELAAARTHLEVAAAADPGDASVWHDLGMVRHGEGDIPGAIAALERATALVPRDARPRTALAALHWKRGDRASATREYRRLLELELPDRVRAKVEWALAVLAKP